jgi:two-component system, cell cycle sensor histidine kinase and response regulator CckA
MMGIPAADIAGRPVWEFIAPGECAVGREAVRRKLSGEQSLGVFERGYQLPGGGLLVLEIHEQYIYNRLGGIAGIRSFLIDVTQRKGAERALGDSERRFRHLVEHASDMIYRANVTGCFTFVNPTATRLLGYSEQELLGRHYSAIVAPSQRSHVEEFYRSQVGARMPFTYLEFACLTKDGREIWLGQKVVLAEEGGEIAGVEAVARDITQQRLATEAQRRTREELEQRVRERTRELELVIEFLQHEIDERQRAEQQRRKLEAQIQHSQRLESLGVLAGGIAHDFNNLLASIMGYAALALQDLPEWSPVRQRIDRVLEAAHAAAELTQQMLAYSGRGQFVLERADLSRIVAEVTRLLGTLISKKATLRLDLASGLPPVEADPSQLRQVVMNLVTNASDSLGDGSGMIRLATSVRALGPGDVPRIDSSSSLPAGDYVVLEVTDSGCGMTEDTRKRIFDPFFTTKFTGRGLGLAAVQGIVRGHGGGIQVESAPGEGTTFRVLFPVVEGKLADSESKREIAGEWRGEGTILVVDDEPAVRELATIIIERSGFTVVTASDGNEAVARFTERQDEIRAVILDLTMPGMDGSEVYRRLQEIRPGMRVVVCSGYNMQDFQARFGDSGTAAFLRKPYVPAGLIGRLREVLESSGAQVVPASQD